MPNTGKPSLACHLCRARRVKCDLTRPGCLRCLKIGTACSGYRQEQDLLFHNQSTASFATNGRKNRERPKRDIVEGCSHSPYSTSNTPPAPFPTLDSLSAATIAVAIEHPSIPPRIVDDWHSYSIPIILNQFSAPTDGTRFYGFLDFLPDLYRETSEGSCLSLATDAVTKTYLSNLSETSLQGSEQVQTYGRALRAMNAALQDPLERVKDSTIIAVWLLGVHEVLVSSPDTFPMITPGPPAWHMHSQGLASLLRVRGPYQFSTKRGRNLFWMIYIFIQTHCLVANAECPPESLDWFELLKSDLTGYDQLAFIASNYKYKISSLCLSIRSYLTHDSIVNEKGILEFTSILKTADVLQNDAYRWSTSIQLQALDLCSLHVINTLRAALLKLQHFLTLLLDRIESHSELCRPDIYCRRQNCRSTVRLLSREILDSLPYELGNGATPQETRSGCWANGLRFLLPLIVVSWMTHGLRQHREEAKLALQRIGQRMGIKLALDCEPPAGRFADE